MQWEVKFWHCLPQHTVGVKSVDELKKTLMKTYYWLINAKYHFSQRAIPAGQGRWSCPSTQSWWGHSWSAVSSPAFLTTRETRSCCRDSSGGQQRWLKEWSISLTRKERELSLSSFRKHNWEGTLSILTSIWRRQSLALLSGGIRMRGNGQKVKHSTFPWTFSVQVPTPWSRLPREVVDVIQKPSGHNHVECALGNPAWAGKLDYTTSSGPFQPYHSVVLLLFSE